MKTCVTHHGGCDCREKEFDKLKTENEKLRDLIEEAHANIKVWIMRPAKTIYDGLEMGIATVPNSLPHGHLKEAMRYWDRTEKKMLEACAPRAKESE